MGRETIRNLWEGEEGASGLGLSVFGVGRLSANLILCGNNFTVYLGGGGGGGGLIFLFSTESRDA